MEKIRVHWKSLFGYGFIFWLLLCLFGKETPKYVVSNFGYYEDTQFPIAENNFPEEYEDFIFGTKNQIFKFGWSLFIWNTVTFVVSLGFCYSTRTVSEVVLKFISRILKNKIAVKVIPPIKNPIMKHHVPQLSDTHIEIKPKKVNSEVSLPNLLIKKTSSNSSHQTAPIAKCQTIYRNNKLFSPQSPEDIKFNKLLEKQCASLREELAKLQAASMKERTVLSRKLETLTKEKRELTNRLVFVQKENRGAKQELEALLQEKNTLLKRLDSATKELRANTKSKKNALTKLEEATTATDNLKRELEQMTRDKEILEGKMKVLQEEYEKLQERVLSSKSSYETNNFHGQAPERDVYDENMLKFENRQNQTDYDVTYDYSPRNKMPRLCASVSSCTVFDTKNIEIEIKRLERNLENLCSPRRDTDDWMTGERESDASLSNREYTSRSMKSASDLLEDNTLVNRTKLKYWGGVAGEMVNALANKMNEKVRYLHNIHEIRPEESTEIDEYDPSAQESLDDINPPKRIVSSSVAFQNFLRSLQPGECIRRQFLSQSDIRF